MSASTSPHHWLVSGVTGKQNAPHHKTLRGARKQQLLYLSVFPSQHTFGICNFFFAAVASALQHQQHQQHRLVSTCRLPLAACLPPLPHTYVSCPINAPPPSSLPACLPPTHAFTPILPLRPSVFVRFPSPLFIYCLALYGDGCCLRRCPCRAQVWRRGGSHDLDTFSRHDLL